MECRWHVRLHDKKHFERYNTMIRLENDSLVNGTVPDSWKISVVYPIHKVILSQAKGQLTRGHRGSNFAFFNVFRKIGA